MKYINGNILGKHILSLLSHNDEVGIVAISQEAKFLGVSSCSDSNMAKATYETKVHFSRFIDGLSISAGKYV